MIVRPFHGLYEAYTKRNCCSAPGAASDDERLFSPITVATDLFISGQGVGLADEAGSDAILETYGHLQNCKQAWRNGTPYSCSLEPVLGTAQAESEFGMIGQW